MALDRLPIDEALSAYLDGLTGVPSGLDGLYREMEDDPDASMMTHPDLGALLEVLVRSAGGRTVLEVGTFVGTSAAWMARGLVVDGRIDTLEADGARADRAEAFLSEQGLADGVRVHRGPAIETLPGFPDGAYDLAYIDADKAGYVAYLEHAVRLVRPGGLIVADNVLAGGRVARPVRERDASAAALAGFTVAALAHPRLRTSVLTVGDGITLSVVLPDAGSAAGDLDAIPILRVADARRSVEWYARIGFAVDWEHRFAPDLPAYVQISLGTARIHLSEHEGDARPGGLVYVRVPDVDAAAAALGVTEIDEMDWGRDFEARDPDGNRIRVGTRAA